MAEDSPDTLAIHNAGVKRINNRPILLIVGFGVVIVLALVYAINNSAKRSHPEAATSQGQPDQHHAVQSTQSTVAELTKGFPESGEVSTPSHDTAFIPPAEAKSPRAGTDQRLASNGTQNTGTSRMTAEDEWLMAYKTAQQRKYQLYETALVAPTRISTQDTKSSGTPFMGNPMNAAGASPTWGGSGPVSAAAQRMQQNGDLQSAALKAALGGQDPNGQDAKNDFAQKEFRSGYLTATREAPLSKYEVKMGTVIPAIMISGVNSDLPGELIAQVSQDVWDTASGRYLLIPQGSKLFGVYDSRVMFGQNRVLVAWTRVTFPDGSALDLGHMSGADQGGYAGFSDKVNNHYTKIFGSALLMSVISAGVQLSQPKNDSPFGQPSAAQTAAGAMAQQLANTGNALLQKNLNIQPTIEVRPGYRFNVMVSKDIILPEPYRKEGA